MDDLPPARTGRIAPIVAAIRHHRRWVIGTVLLVLAATAIAYALVPRRFTARADLWLDHGFERLGAAGTIAASNSPLARNTELRLLGSRDLAAAVVDRMGLANVRGIGQPQAGPPVAAADARRAAIDTIADTLAIETNGNSYAVAVRFAAPDPVLATGILNHLVDSYVADRRTGGALGRRRNALQAQVAAAREAAIGRVAAVRGYDEAIGLARSPAERAAIRTELASLDGAIREAAGEETTAEARLKAAQGGGTERITSPRIRDLRARSADAGWFGGGDVQRDLATEIRRVTRLADAADAARGRANLLRSARARAAGELKAADDATALKKRLDDQAATARLRYTDLATRYQALVAQARRDPGTAYVISRATVPGARRVPDPLLFALGGLAAALLAALAVVLVRELATRGFRSRQQMERQIGRPVIGMVPDLARVADADFPADDPMGPPDYLYNHRRSPFAAAFRTIHTGLRLGVSGRSLRSVAICSALAEEGKTTVALCLARSAALAGLRVVLVDCDGRRPAASRALSPYVKTGLAQVLEDGVDYRDALQVDVPSGAWFLAQANERPVIHGAVATPQMEALVRQLERVYDLVLLDTAPTLALSEARELAAMADGVLLVARARRTPADATRMAKDMLEQAGAKVVATALTMVAS
ncbi:polysaccharide biosynthesis tyrosine autokinase [Sphingomonas profundi]|uniref:polysaccharide biosynthesis tyrosine autokinase n=1 Tax=Alterirhizorhabdus profundi TaxID=2681549 RepID=UPI0012E91DD9|nr:polysaccharide biosynthesis tyrosine autokinase [Sphingomonas profundi]